MASIEGYDARLVKTCHRVLLEVFTVLGKHRKHLVIVGGWVPTILFPAAGHIGSLDVDVAIDPTALPDWVYETIRNELSGAGFERRTDDPPSRFRRSVRSGADTIEVKVDLLTGVADAGGSTHKILQGLPVWMARGVEIAFESSAEHRIEGRLPRGERNSVSVRVATAAALVVMKALALDERMKEKDAYDLYFCLAHDPRGPDGIAHELAALGPSKNQIQF